MNTTTSDEDKKSSFNNLTLRTFETIGSGAAAIAPVPNALFKQKSSNDAVKMRYMGSRNHDLQRLTLTTNSLVSPADLEAASDFELD